MTKKTGYKDRNGKDICVGDYFKWFLPAGFQTCYWEPFPLLAEWYGWKIGCISKKFEETAVIVEKDDRFVLLGTGDNKGWESFLDGEFPDGSFRYEHGEIINSILEVT